MKVDSVAVAEDNTVAPAGPPMRKCRCVKPLASTPTWWRRPIASLTSMSRYRSDYIFDRETTLAILAGFAFNRRVLVSGYHAPANRPMSSRSRRG